MGVDWLLFESALRFRAIRGVLHRSAIRSRQKALCTKYRRIRDLTRRWRDRVLHADRPTDKRNDNGALAGTDLLWAELRQKCRS
jgi:hypothetical protein